MPLNGQSQQAPAPDPVENFPEHHRRIRAEPDWFRRRNQGLQLWNQMEPDVEPGAQVQPELRMPALPRPGEGREVDQPLCTSSLAAPQGEAPSGMLTPACGATSLGALSLGTSPGQRHGPAPRYPVAGELVGRAHLRSNTGAQGASRIRRGPCHLWCSGRLQRSQ